MSDYAEGIKEVMRDLVSAAKSQCAWMYEDLPREATTDAQKELQVKHGSPYEFGRSVVNALDMITPSEARAAIEKYAREWQEAGRA